MHIRAQTTALFTLLSALALALPACAEEQPQPASPSGAPGAATSSGTPVNTPRTGAGARRQHGYSVRAGYELTPAADPVPGGRFLEFDDRGNLFISCPNFAHVLMLSDTDGDGFLETRRIIAEGPDLQSVHGLCFHRAPDGTRWLWIAPTDSIHKVRLDNLPPEGELPERLTVIPSGRLPEGGSHWWRSLLVTDAHLYTSVGDSGNITDESNSERQKIWRFDHEGGKKTLFVSGIRNTEKLRLRPGTSEVWGIDHGSDNFGAPYGESRRTYGPVTDFNPFCELNHYTQGAFYGHPFVTGYRLPRAEYAFGDNKRRDILDIADRTTVPEFVFGAHTAANSFTFLDPARCGPNHSMPADHAGDLFVAARGSWNRRELAGYFVARVLFDSGRPYGMLEIVSTLADDGETHSGKPIDCAHAPDGSVLFSVDTTPGTRDARIFRIRHTGD